MTVTTDQPTGPVWPSAPCGSCSAPVVWAVTINGKRMPVDAEPSERGNLLLEDTGTPTPLVRVVNAHLHEGGGLRMSHFVTCPHAPEWRRRPGGREHR